MELRLWQVLFPFILISKSWSSNLVSELLLFSLNMHWYQYTCLKGPLLDTEASLLNLIEHFNLFNTEAIPSFKLLDNFPDHISFYPCNCLSFSSCKFHLKSLDHLCLKAFFFFSTLIFVTDISATSFRNIYIISTAHS